MNIKSKSNHLTPLALTLLFVASCLTLSAQQVSTAERVAKLKASLTASKAVLKQYEWIQTTVISVNGEDKSSKEERCYYGAEGGIQKIEIDSTSEPGPRFGLRKRIAKHKKEEMTDFMKSAVALLKLYVPPTSEQVQAAKDAGNASISILDPGKRVRVSFADYQKPGDQLGIEVDLTNNHLLGMSVSTYVDDPSQAVTLNVTMGQLEGGASYPATATLNVPGKNLTVEVENSGYRKMN